MTIERYNLIRPYLDQFKRRFTLLDLGAGIHTHISKDISNDYDCVAVVVEQDITDLEGYGPHTIVLKHHVTADELARLSECEHFDVVLALNFLHHFPMSEWHVAASAVLGMGTYVYVQLPNIGESTPGQEFLPELRRMIMGLNPDIVGNTVQFPGHPARALCGLECKYRVLERTHMYAHFNSAHTLIADNFENVQGLIKGKEWKDWIPGINLWNFCKLGGVLPSKDKILDMLGEFPLPSRNHGDIVPHNFILDGERLYLVDGFEGWEFNDEVGLKVTIQEVKKCLFT